MYAIEKLSRTVPGNAGEEESVPLSEECDSYLVSDPIENPDFLRCWHTAVSQLLRINDHGQVPREDALVLELTQDRVDHNDRGKA